MSENKKLTREANIRKQLDDCMPMGVHAPMHQSQLAREGALNAYASEIARGDGGGGLTRKADLGIGQSANAPFVSRTPLLYVDPMFDPILFLFPKDRIDEINKRLRHYYETNAIVGSAIDLHSSLPLSDFYLECEDPETERYWNDFKDRSGLLEYLRCMVHDYFLLGESVGLPIWDANNYEFSHFNQYPPENVDIFRTYVTPTAFFMLKPDPKLAEKVQSSNAADKTLLGMMPADYVESLKEGRPYLLGSDKKVIYLARQSTKYRNRGVSLLSRILKDLLYRDKLRLLQLTFVDRHFQPIKIFKLGSESRGWIPNKKHFVKLQQLLAQASGDPDFNILFHFGLTVDYVGTKDKIWNLIPEFEWIDKQLMAGLFVNEEIIHGGLPSAVRDTVNLRTLMHRYQDIREKVERIMITHVFLPIARARGFYKKGMHLRAKEQDKMVRIGANGPEVEGAYLDKENGIYRIANSRHAGLDLSCYDLPRPIWRKLNLVNNLSEQQVLINMESEGKFPIEMIYDMMGFDPKIIKSKLQAQYSTPLDPVWRRIRESIAETKQVRLQVLRGKKPNEWKIEPGQDLEASPVSPGQAKKPAAPMAAPGGGSSAPAAKPAAPKEKPATQQPGGFTPPTKSPTPTMPPAKPAPTNTPPVAPLNPTTPPAQQNG